MEETNGTCVAEAAGYAASDPKKSSVAYLCDELLVDLAKAGDEQAYVELYSRHSPMAARVVQRITQNAEDTEDVLQEACIRAFRHLHSFDGRAAFSTWLTLAFAELSEHNRFTLIFQ